MPLSADGAFGPVATTESVWPDSFAGPAEAPLRTLIDAIVPSSATLGPGLGDGAAVGASFTALTVIVTVAGSESVKPSFAL